MVSSVFAIRPGGPARARLRPRRCTLVRDRSAPMNVLALVSAPGMPLDPVLIELDHLRSDGTLVATNSHSPVDRTLLGAGLRVLPRTILRAKVVLPNAVPIRRPAGRNRSRRVRQVLNGRIDAARRRGEGAAAARHARYRRLVGLTPQVVTQAQHLAPARAAVP